MGNNQSINIGEKIILKILNDYKEKNPKKYNLLSNTDKVNYLKKELNKYNLFINDDSNEYKKINDLVTKYKDLHDSLNNILTTYGYMQEQNKLFRLSFNIDTLLINFIKLNDTINLIKNYETFLKSFIIKSLKYVEKYKVENNKTKISQKSSNSKKNKTRKSIKN